MIKSPSLDRLRNHQLVVSGSSIKIEVTTKLEIKGCPVPNGETKCQKVNDIDDSHSNTGFWGKCGKISLSKSQRQEIKQGDWLNDYHINFAIILS